MDENNSKRALVPIKKNISIIYCKRLNVYFVRFLYRKQ